MKFRGRPRFIKEHLSKNKLPEMKGEGYDGHLDWDPDAKENIYNMAAFRQAAAAGDNSKILEIIVELSPYGNEALMCAICSGSRPLTEFILSLFYEFPSEERTGCSNAPGFTSHVTPLMLACMMNNFAIVECLLLRGGCVPCRAVPNSNTELVRRVDVYRAVSSEAWLWLSTPDPLAAAAALAADLEEEIKDDNLEFVDIYRQLHINVEHFALRLVEQCWKVEEVDLFLSQRPLTSTTTCETPYPRVRMALDSGLKHFAASVPVQRAVASLWWQGWGKVGSNPSRDAFRVLRHVFLYPLLAVLFIITNGKIGGGFKVPLARYTSYTTSYVVFLIGLVVLRYMRRGNDGADKYDRDIADNWEQMAFEGYTFIYVLGLVLERYLEFARRGLKSYFSLWWRWFDFLMLGSFMLAMFIWVTALAVGLVQDDYHKKINRRHWAHYDIFLLYDIFMSIGCILAFWRIFYFFQLKKGVGGCIISIGRCVSQIYSYLFVMIIIMISFAIGLNWLAMPYIGVTEVSANGASTTSSEFFSSIHLGVRHLYWAFYGYLDFGSYGLKTGNAGPEQAPVSNRIIQVASEGITMAYHSILIITLLNLMISLLVKKADEVLDNEELEFKYTRACIYSEYFESSISVPPPFNVIYVVVQFFRALLNPKTKMSWPEIYAPRSLLEATTESMALERVVYERLIVQMFGRFRATQEFHYTNVFRSEYEKEKKAYPPRVVFMNC